MNVLRNNAGAQKQNIIGTFSFQLSYEKYPNALT
jgi:hypothetical protein